MPAHAGRAWRGARGSRWSWQPRGVGSHCAARTAQRRPGQVDVHAGAIVPPGTGGRYSPGRGLTPVTEAARLLQRRSRAGRPMGRAALEPHATEAQGARHGTRNRGGRARTGVQEGPAGRRRHQPPRCRRRDLRVPGPERRRKSRPRSRCSSPSSPQRRRRAIVGGFDVVAPGQQVRRVIGVALQDAAVDPLLTAREHSVLQAGLHGFSRPRREARARNCCERVGLTGRRRSQVGTYSGGMRRRLDLALALVHRPADRVSRRADDRPRSSKPGGAVGRGRAPCRARGRHRVPHDAVPRRGRRARGRIGDHRAGAHRGRGNAGPAQGRGRPTGDGSEQHRPVPRTRRASARCSSASASQSADRPAPWPFDVRRDSELAEIVRTLDAAGAEVANLELHAPTLDDVFLEKTGRKLEGEGAEQEPEAEAAVEPAPEPEVELRRLSPPAAGSSVSRPRCSRNGWPSGASITETRQAAYPDGRSSFARVRSPVRRSP